VVDAFLQAGWRVKGTVRNKSKADHIRSRYPSHADQLELVEVKDIVSGDGLKEAMQGVDAVAHTASPCKQGPPSAAAQSFILLS
jgi:nucleoside-diphosphate-sugar epimerase